MVLLFTILGLIERLEEIEAENIHLKREVKMLKSMK
jgi:hypothetical protein